MIHTTKKANKEVVKRLKNAIKKLNLRTANARKMAKRNLKRICRGWMALLCLIGANAVKWISG